MTFSGTYSNVSLMMPSDVVWRIEQAADNAGERQGEWLRETIMARLERREPISTKDKKS